MWKNITNITTMLVQRNITKTSITTVETNEERKPATNPGDETQNLGFHSSQSDRDNLDNEVRDAVQNLALDEKKDENETKRSDVGDDNDDRNEMRSEEANEGDEDADGDKNGEENFGEEGEKIGSFNYPIRPDAEDCSYYLRTGTCKFGLSCKFNHPIRKKIQGVTERVKEREELPERTGQPECKYYLRTGGCKFGKACRYNHSRAKSPAVSILEFNFLGLPIRLGEKECPYYMRTGSCKYGTSCKFNHPDPVGGSDPPLQSTSQTTMASWSSPRSSSETASYVPLMYPPSQRIPPNPEWLAYQAPVYPSEGTLHPPPTYLINNQPTETKVYAQQQQIMVDEFPERPGQPECSYFLKTGDCKYRSGCKFHHPKNRITQSNPCVLSDKGLPLRPDQSICSHYSRYGLCKFGPACKFDHPINHSPAMSGLHQSLPPSSGSFTNRTGMTAHENGNEALIQQPI